MTRPQRLFVPVVTPFGADLSPDPERLLRLCRWLLAEGADGLAVFGTTSEASSLSVEERTRLLDHLVSAGIDPARLLPGTGCAALPDTIRLTAHATALGVKGVLTLPPYYFKNPPEDGIFAAYARTLDAVPDARLYLYHFPQMSGVPLTLSLIERLVAAFGERVAGLKDSSGDWSNTAAVIDAFPALEVFPSSEAMIPQGAAAGAAGCISATANVNPDGIARLIAALDTADEAPALAAAAAIRARVSALPLVPATKAAVAHRLGDPGFATVRPPLAPLGAEEAASLARDLDPMLGRSVDADA
jgi:4-hydroxy-tetrahydrodipicolinate synthase